MLATFFEPATQTPLEVTVLLGAGFGALLGAVVGLCQMRVATAPRWWLWSAIGWSCCFVLRAIATDLIPYGPDSLQGVVTGAFGALVGGLAIGLITSGPARALRSSSRTDQNAS